MKIDIVRAWKDMQYWESLSAKQQMLVPENPIGMLVLADEDLASVQGADGIDNYGITFGTGCGNANGIGNGSGNNSGNGNNVNVSLFSLSFR